MPRRPHFRLWAALGTLVVVSTGMTAGDPQSAQPTRREATATVKRRDFIRSIRLSGTVEAVDSTTLSAPRLSGPNSSSLVITKLVKPGASVRKGDIVVEFDRQAQLATALDKRAELNDLEQQNEMLPKIQVEKTSRGSIRPTRR